MGYRTATLDNILAERLMELMWEGWRRNDLIRFDRFHQSYANVLHLQQKPTDILLSSLFLHEH